jgi:AraC-like DNA-binding protein
MEVMERMPQWVWWVLGVLFAVMLALISYVWFLHRQRRRFMETIRRLPLQEQTVTNRQNEETEVPIVQAEVQPNEYVKDEWLKKAMNLIEEHLSDEHYSVEQLSADLCMSRMTFYRKIQSATGQKPTEFIRTIRLRRAAELLHEGRLTVSEICYATGFSSVSYFSRCFRTMFGISPTQFIEEHRII